MSTDWLLRSILGKMVHDTWRTVLIWAVFTGLFAAMYIGLYPSIGAVGEIQNLLDSLPPAVRALFSSENLDIGTAAGFLNIELFSFVAPFMVMGWSVALGAGSVAGEEERGTMDVLLAAPVRRSRIIVEKAVGITLGTTAICAAIWVGVVGTAALVDVEIDAGLVAAACASVGFLGLAMGGIGLALGALTGRRNTAIGLTIGFAIVAYLVNALGPLVSGMDPWRVLSPIYHYVGYDPLRNGLAWDHAAVLAAIGVGGVLVALVGFERRDVRHG